ncbi:MAG TPA: hypothetical protein VGG64_08765 [Pirellulales bacterium]|jgi:hypothetical protein
MWLSAHHEFNITRYDSAQATIPWRVDVHAIVDDPEPGAREEFTVGRILADELRPGEIDELGDDPWDVADADSSGLEAAYAAVLDEHGCFRDDEFTAGGDQIVYLYRFALHPDFVDWRLAVMDSFCRLFASPSAVILAQRHTTLFSDTELSEVGFRLLAPTVYRGPKGARRIDRTTEFYVRDCTLKTRFELRDVIDIEPPSATSAHEKWLETCGPWDKLC